MAEGTTRRRRAHGRERKAEVLAACARPGASVAAIALARGLNANLVHKWRRQAARVGGMPATRSASVALATPGSAEFVALPLPTATPAIRIEVRRGATAIAVHWPPRRRRLCIALAAAFVPWPAGAARASGLRHPERRWYDAAEAMRQRALGWGDQPYGAVLVTADGVVAEGPSRVVRNADPEAHAEREALREAQRLLGRRDLSGAVLYATSWPCRACEQAAARAGVRRMYVGPDLVDAGAPRP